MSQMVGISYNQIYENLLSRNDSLGLARWDPTDFNACWPIPWLVSNCHRRDARVLWKILKIPSLLMPCLYRRILRIDKTVAPTCFYHLGNAYLYSMQWNPQRRDEWIQRLLAVGEGALKIAGKRRNHLYWGCGRLFATSSGNMQPDEPCSHHTARVGYVLIRIGRELGEERFIAAGVEAAKGMSELFNWQEKPGGLLTVSYFPLMHDETINIFTDTAMLLSEASIVDPNNEELIRRVNGLVRTTLTEQDQDGRWGYETADYYASTHKPFFVDNLHTAMVISGLTRVINCKVLEEALVHRTVQAIRRGAEFYYNNLFTSEGYAYRYHGKHSGEASISGYCEGVICLYDLLTSQINLGDLRERLNMSSLIAPILETAVRRFIDFRTWDVSCKRHGRLRINIKSLRWGSGLLMEAISRYLAWNKTS